MPPPLARPSRLECSACRKEYDPSAPRNVCDCGKPLFVRYGLEAVSRDALLVRRALWRSLPVLPVASEDRIVSLGEGGTPLLRCPAIERTYGLRQVFVKEEAANPTGTFKARGMAAGGLGGAVARAAGWFDGATMEEPYRVEGKKTMGYELWEQLGGLPDWVVFPTGGGTGVVGLWKAFQELKELGWHDGPLPRIAFVQAAGCAPLVRAFEVGKDGSDPWKGPPPPAPPGGGR